MDVLSVECLQYCISALTATVFYANGATDTRSAIFLTKIFRYNYRNISNELLQQTPLNIYGAHIHIPGSILVYLFLLLVIHKELSLAQLVASVGVQPHQPIMSQL